MTLVDVREKDEWRGGLHPRRHLDPARVPRDPGRAEAPRQERAHRRLLRRRHALGARRRDAAGARLHARRDRQPRLRALEGSRLPDRAARRSSPTRSASATRATSSCPRSARRVRRKLLKSKVLLLGAGGLGSPAALYLAAAGVGTLGIVDADVVDASNLQRQIIHATSRVGTPEGRERREGDRRSEPRREGRARTRSASTAATSSASSPTTRSSSTGRTTSRRGTSSTTRASSSASRSCTEASSASTGR